MTTAESRKTEAERGKTKPERRKKEDESRDLKEERQKKEQKEELRLRGPELADVVAFAGFASRAARAKRDLALRYCFVFKVISSSI